MKAYLYTRFSGRLTTGEQRTILRRYAAKHGLTIVREFSEKDSRGSSMKKRVRRIGGLK